MIAPEEGAEPKGTWSPPNVDGAKRKPSDGERRTDVGNARRIARMYGDRMRHTGAVGWHVWNGKRWEPDDTGEPLRLAIRSAVSMLDEVKEMGTSENAQDWSKWAIRSQAKNRIDAALGLAAADEGIAVRRVAFDADPWTLNVENGTLDLKTTVLRPHRKEDLLSKVCAAAYEDEASCPLWLSFLEKFLPDPEVRAYVRRYLGSWLTGDTGDQALVIFHGPGGNGKSTLVETVTRILGDYFVGTPFSTLTMNRDRGQATNDLAALAGARAVVAVEPPEGTILNTATVKQLTGGDTITARHLYREFFSFVPQFKLLLVTNHKPQVTETTHAIWRRVHLVPFLVTIREDERDEGFKARLWEERNGILKWLVEGCCEWQLRGILPPAAVVAATEQYQREEDSFGAFVEECCVLGVQDTKVRAGLLLTAYNQWSKANGNDPVSSKMLSRKLASRGLESRKSDGCVFWLKIGLRDTPGQGG